VCSGADVRCNERKGLCWQARRHKRRWLFIRAAVPRAGTAVFAAHVCKDRYAMRVRVPAKPTRDTIFYASSAAVRDGVRYAAKSASNACGVYSIEAR